MMADVFAPLRSENARIAIVGGGKMGEAIFAGWISASDGAAAAWSPSNFTVVEPTPERSDYLREAHGVTCISDVSELVPCDMILLSVKPQVMASVLQSMGALDFASDPLVVSIAAGLSTAKLEAMLPEGTHLVRVMPNMPLQVGMGATTLCRGTHATAEELDFVTELFSCIGEAHQVSEELMDVTCAINGSGPAYFAAMIEAMASAAAEAGLDRDLAERLATQTALGTAGLMIQRNRSAEAVRIDVSSPGGTTLAALDAMEKAGFAQAVSEGVAAAIRRSKELGS